MATVQDGYPLYFDGANEEGLGMAGLNFDGPCHYFPEDPKKIMLRRLNLSHMFLVNAKILVKPRK